jgi:hypothetical protein
MKTITYTVDFKNVTNQTEIGLRIRQSLKCFPSVSEEIYIERVRRGLSSSWDALNDDLSGLPNELTDSGTEEVTLILTNTKDIVANISQEEYDHMISILDNLTLPSERIDNLKFSYIIQS